MALVFAVLAQADDTVLTFSNGSSFAPGSTYDVYGVTWSSGEFELFANGLRSHLVEAEVKVRLPYNAPLKVGTYEASCNEWQSQKPYFYASGHYLGYPTSEYRASFEIKKVIYSAFSVAALWLTFEQTGPNGERIAGELRYHADSAAASVNQAPSAHLMGPVRVELGTTHSYSAELFDDDLPIDATLTAAWSVKSGSTGVELSTAAGLSTAATFRTSGKQTLLLTVSDGDRSKVFPIEVSVEVPFAESLLNVTGPATAGGSRSVIYDRSQVNIQPFYQSGTFAYDVSIFGPASQYWFFWISTRDSPLPEGSFEYFTQFSGNVPSFTMSAPSDGWYGYGAPLETHVEVSRLPAPGGATAPSWVKFIRYLDPLRPPYLGEIRDRIPLATAAGAPPLVGAGVDRKLTRLSERRLHGAALALYGASDQPLSTHWSVVSGPGEVTFADAAAPETDVTFGTDGIYVLRLTAIQGEVSATSDVTIDYTTCESSLVARRLWDGTAHAAYLHPEENDVVLDSYDGTTVSFSCGDWRARFNSGLDRPLLPGTYDIDNQTAGGPSMHVSDRYESSSDRKGTFTVHELTTDDEGHLTSARIGFAFYSDIWWLDIKDPTVGEIRYRSEFIDGSNRAPRVRAGSPQFLGSARKTVVEAEFVDDLLPHGHGLERSWSVVSGPGTASFQHLSDRRTEVEFSKAGIYRLRYSVSDGELQGADDLVVVAGQKRTLTYHGLIRDNGALVGVFHVRILPSGSFTGSLRLGGDQHAISGSFSAGSWRKVIGTSSEGAVVLTLGLDPTRDSLEGELDFGSRPVLLHAEQTNTEYLDATLQQSRFVGNYTWICGVGEDLPGPIGYGSGTMQVSSHGLVRWTGRFADGAVVSAGGPLALDDSCTLYTYQPAVAAYAGDLHFFPATGSGLTMSGSLGWARFGKPRLSTGLWVAGARYRRPPAGENAFLAGDRLVLDAAWKSRGGDEATGAVTLTAANRFLPSPNLILRSNPATGLFSGTWKQGGKTAQVYGAFLQPFGAGYGYFNANGQPYALRLGATTDPR